MRYQILYDYRVARYDIPALSSATKQRIQTAIDQKLSVRPNLYGVALRRSLKGYRKLRVGDYRIIFSIKDQLVTVLIIGHRSTVDKVTKKRRPNYIRG